MTYKEDMLKWAKERDEIARLYKSGLTKREIATKLGVSNTAIYHRLKKFGNKFIKARGKPKKIKKADVRKPDKV